VRVELTWSEIKVGGEIAITRRLRGIKGSVQPTYGSQANGGLGFDGEVRGVLAEIAAAKFLGVYWPGFGLTVGDIDVGVAEVRSVDDPERRLMLHPKDKDELPFILVLVVPEDLPCVTLLGWILARDGKQKRNWSDPTGKGRHAYFVDNADLLPMADLLILLRERVAA